MENANGASVHWRRARGGCGEVCFPGCEMVELNAEVLDQPERMRGIKRALKNSRKHCVFSMRQHCYNCRDRFLSSTGLTFTTDTHSNEIMTPKENLEADVEPDLGQHQAGVLHSSDLQPPAPSHQFCAGKEKVFSARDVTVQPIPGKPRPDTFHT